jgi:hypothetical protein
MSCVPNVVSHEWGMQRIAVPHSSSPLTRYPSTLTC